MQQKIAVVTGPTATGKTRLGIILAQCLNGEIVSGDSMQIYRGMDIGTAKPTPRELSQARHHLIDAADPSEEWSVSRYVEAADAADAANAADAAGSKTADARAELFRCIRRGLPQAAAACAALLEREAPLDVVNGSLIPALNEVGDDYEKGVLFLPQLIAAAESAKLCFDEVKKRLPGGETERGKIVLATVKGDIHDIGKNIARTVLENYGYKVIDLGKNVPPEQVAAACEREDVLLCGLSALMTTTVPAMEETIRLLRARCPGCRVMVGGAVLTAGFAKKIGADWYCKDANADVKIARYLFEGGEEVPTL